MPHVDQAAPALAVSRSAPLALSADRAPVLALLLMALSGFAGLGYQIIWTEQFGVWLGHDIVAVLAVVAAFFGGIGLGARLLARPIAASRRPAAWYAALEAVIGAWGLALIALMPAANARLAALTGPQPGAFWQWTIAFAGPFVLLLPATLAMGATLPAIERVLALAHTGARGDDRGGGSIGGLYAANTLGAVTGVLAAAFVLVPALGLSRTAMVCAGINLLCATVAALAWRAHAPARSRSTPGLASAFENTPKQLVWLPRPTGERAGVRGARLARTASPPSPPATRTRHRVLWVLLATGALGIGYEVVAVRVLSQMAEDTVYTFALLLAAYLLGTAAGAAFYQRRLSPNRTDDDALRSRLLGALALACLAGTTTLWGGEGLRAAVSGALGGGPGGALAGEAAIALAAFALPTFVMGALFSHLCARALAGGHDLGAALGANTLGAAFAPLLFGVLLVPSFGPKAVLLAIGVGYLLLAPYRHWHLPRIWLPACATLAVAAVTGPLAFVDVPEGGHVVSYRDGVMASVSVVEDSEGVARLRIDNRQQEGSSASLLSDARLAYLPLLLHPAPADVLFLGLGTGLTAASAAEDATLSVDAVELLPEVIAAAPAFAGALGAADNRPAPRVLAGDARRYVRTAGKRYDVIVADLFHPARSGAGALYTVEHFEAIRARLRPGGLFCQWLPLHQLDLDTLRSIMASFIAVHPGAFAILANNSLETPVIGLIARSDGARFDPADVARRLAAHPLPSRLAQFQLNDDFAPLGALIAGPAELARYSAGAPLNTDDRPVVAHRAPFVTYAPDSLPRDRLLALLRALRPLQPADVLAAGHDANLDADAIAHRERLAAYWSARTRFIEAGMAVRPGGDARAMLAQVREPLLDIVRASPDFRPAYDPLLNLARAVARDDPGAARALLAELAQANPARPEAAQWLRRLGP